MGTITVQGTSLLFLSSLFPTPMSIHTTNPLESVSMMFDLKATPAVSSVPLDSSLMDFAMQGTNHVALGVSLAGSDTGIQVVNTGVAVDDVPAYLERLEATARSNDWSVDRLWIMSPKGVAKVFAEQAEVKA